MNLDWNTIGLVFSFVVNSGIGGFMWKMYKSYHDKEEAKAIEKAVQDKTIRQAMRSILRTEIIKTCLLAESRGYIPLHDVENLNDMQSCYEALGGNGTTKQLCVQALQLPHKQGELKNETD